MSKEEKTQAQEEIEGLLLCGVVSGRSRRTVGEKMSELVTYKVSTNRQGYNEMFLKEWNSNGAYFQIGEAICVPVTVKSYTKDGRTMFDYTLYKGSQMTGEEF